MGNHSTDFLTPASSFLTGAGSVFALAGSYYSYNRSSTPQEADERAIRSDWAMIGQDIEQATRRELLANLASDDNK
jgi:hypothetical protein